MKVRDIMTRQVEVIPPDAPVQEAAEKMRVLDVGPLPVCDGDRLVGMVTDRDITVRATAEGRDPYSTKVREVMSADVIYCFEDEDIERAAQLMKDKQIRRLAVLDRNQRLVGIVSLGDLAVQTGNQQKAGEVLEDISQPGAP
ncbi:MAG: CBS domain-containing protein [Isosphaeraceae bacterium]|nr:CBS domain-containing protein [Isosphaeraceae bacterium]